MNRMEHIKLRTAKMKKCNEIWTKAEFLAADDDSRLAEEVGYSGICGGMSTDWLRGVLQFGRPITSTPQLSQAYMIQCILGFVSAVDYLKLADMDVEDYTYDDNYEEALENIWNTPEDPPAGFLICVWPDDGEMDGHATAFIKQNGRGYFMGPNSGLYSCDTLEEFMEIFRQEEPHVHYEYKPYNIRTYQATPNQSALSIATPELVTYDTDEEYQPDDASEVCNGMSFTWLRRILKFDFRPTHMPNLETSANLQDNYLEGESFFNLASQADLEHVEDRSYSDYDDCLDELWEVSPDDFVGHHIGIYTPDASEYLHAVAFVKKDGRGYLMRPNSGVHSCATLDVLKNAFFEDLEPIVAGEDYSIHAIELKCNGDLLYSPMEHWRREQYEEQESDLIVQAFDEIEADTESDMTAGVAVEWLKEVLKFNLPIRCMPNLRWAIFLQYRFVYVQDDNYTKYSVTDYASLAGLNYESQNLFETREELVSEIWSNAEEDVGYLIGDCEYQITKDATAIIMKDGRAYFLQPKSGLVSYGSEDELLEAFTDKYPYLEDLQCHVFGVEEEEKKEGTLAKLRNNAFNTTLFSITGIYSLMQFIITSFLLIL